MIRSDQFEVPQKLEVAFLIALGESLLGDYARDKVMEEVVMAGLRLGKVYHLRLQAEQQRTCYFSNEELHRYLILARMLPSDDPCHFTRLINGGRGLHPARAVDGTDVRMVSGKPSGQPYRIQDVDRPGSASRISFRNS